MAFKYDICIVGGCGHIGLPLGLAFANKSKNVVLYDINQESVAIVNKNKMPFIEEGGQNALAISRKNKNIRATSNPHVIALSKVVIVCIGTPLNKNRKPSERKFLQTIGSIEKLLNNSQLLILCSTLYPGTTEKINSLLKKRGKSTPVAYCPERVTEGHALKEFSQLPQIVAGSTIKASKQAVDLFELLTRKIIRLSPAEAEVAKLFSNAWRYTNFAISNQFYMIATSHNLDFYTIQKAITKDYPRLEAFAGPGFTAGPCLLQDTMQLYAFSNNHFSLGKNAAQINESLPDYIVNSMKNKFELKNNTVAILGMAFKGDSDDPRESLSFKLRSKLKTEAKNVLCHDPYIKDKHFTTLSNIKKHADIIVIATPHSDYKIENWGDKHLVDIWNFYGRGGMIQ